MTRSDLAQKIRTLEGLSPDDKSALLGLLNEQKRYGLVWEDKPEAVEEQLRAALPVLEEVPERRIVAENSLPLKGGTGEAREQGDVRATPPTLDFGTPVTTFEGTGTTYLSF